MGRTIHKIGLDSLSALALPPGRSTSPTAQLTETNHYPLDALKICCRSEMKIASLIGTRVDIDVVSITTL
jgi:hypothetical protein